MSMTNPRPWTPDRPSTSGGRRITVKRMCNGCGRALGDVTHDEIEAAVAGRPLPDVREECGCDWDQPPGVRADAPTGWMESVPSTEAAAERILEFVKDFGDGRVYGHPDQPGIEPLYARDLEKLARGYLREWDRAHSQKAATP